MQRLRHVDWDAVAGVVAAVVALVLHLLHVVDEGVLLAITLVILALILIRDLRQEEHAERIGQAVERTEQAVRRVQEALAPPDTLLVGPDRLQAASEAFARQAGGEMVWFNVCLQMFVPQALFDVPLRPAIENPRVTAIQFVLDRGERQRWQADVLPKIAACSGREKVREPQWAELPESISYILAHQEPGGALEAQLSFWGEPFMARAPGRSVPRYIFHVQGHSELIPRLIEVHRLSRLDAQQQ